MAVITLKNIFQKMRLLLNFAPIFIIACQLSAWSRASGFAILILKSFQNNLELFYNCSKFWFFLWSCQIITMQPFHKAIEKGPNEHISTVFRA